MALSEEKELKLLEELEDLEIFKRGVSIIYDDEGEYGSISPSHNHEYAIEQEGVPILRDGMLMFKKEDIQRIFKHFAVQFIVVNEPEEEMPDEK